MSGTKELTAEALERELEEAERKLAETEALIDTVKREMEKEAPPAPKMEEKGKERGR